MKQITNTKDFIAKLKKLFNFLTKNNWIFTVVFFLGIFFSSVVIWLQVVIKPQVNEKIKGEIEASKKDYPMMMREIEKVAEMLSEKKNNFNNQPPINLERRLFYEEKTDPEQSPEVLENNSPQPAP